MNWYYDGLYYRFYETPFDIIKVEQPKFDWSQAKWGMAFEYQNKSQHKPIYFYIGKGKNPNTLAMYSPDSDNYFEFELKGFNFDLIRLPEEDWKLP